MVTRVTTSSGVRPSMQQLIAPLATDRGAKAGIRAPRSNVRQSAASDVVVSTKADGRSSMIGTVTTGKAPVINPKLDASIAERTAYIQRIYQDIHSHPELSLKETRTAKIVADEMRQLGFDVTEGVGGTGVVSVMKNGDGPTLMIRADMDALPIQEETGLPYASQTPGVMHACGHDLHTTTALGVAYALSKHRELWKGTLVMVAQPAEEIGAGAAAMLNDGLFTRFPKPQNIIAYHTSGVDLAGTVTFATGAAYSADDVFDITFHGQGGHGSAPNLTVDPIAMMAEFIEKIHTLVAEEVDPRDFAVITVGSAHAGTTGNVIPDTARVQGTIRTYNPKVRQLLKERLGDVAKAISTGARGAPPDVKFTASIDPTVNDAALAERLVPAMQSAAIDGQAKRVPGVTPSEDFGAYGPAAGAPAFMFWVGVQHSLTPPVFTNHTSKFAPDFVPSFTAAARALAQSVLTLLPAPATPRT